MTNLLQINLLGDFTVEYNGSVIAAFNADRLQVLLAYLLLHRQSPQPRHHLAFQLWPDSNESQARTNLRNLLHNLRLHLPDADEFLTTTNLILQWRETAPANIDIDQFEYHHAAAVAAQNRGELVEAQRNLQEALAIYRGHLLPGNYEDWAVIKRETLRQLYNDALTRMVTLLESAGDARRALAYGQRLLLDDPLNETTYVMLMQLHAHVGDRGAVRRIYEQCAATLQKELGVDPSNTTQTAYAQLLRTEAPTSRPVPLAAAPTRRKLSPPRSSALFIGREVELTELAQRLDDPHCRLLTITGPGGIGKTGLALQSAHGHAALYEEGAAFVDLAPLTSADRLVSTIAGEMGISLSSGANSEEQLLQSLADKEILLVLDNFEHLLEGADLLAEILDHAPRVKLLVTSRERLNLQEEWVYDLYGLTVAAWDDTEWIDNSAIQLFIQSARRANASFQPGADDRAAITQICRLVDGMPLGIQLAAAWIRMLTPQEIAAEIQHSLTFLESNHRDIPERHRSLQAVFEHSWRLLSATEQHVCRRLSIFRGGFERTMAEKVAGATLPVLSALVDKSLIRPADAGRYSIHEVVRQYAASILLNAGEFESTRIRHLQAYLTLASQLQQRLFGPTQPAILDQLETEHDNLRAALEWSLPPIPSTDGSELNVRPPAQPTSPPVSLPSPVELVNSARMASILGRFWYLRGYLYEGRSWLVRALSALEQVAPSTPFTEFTSIRAWLLFGLGEMIAASVGVVQAIDHLQESLTLFRQLDNPRNVVFALHRLGETLFEGGDFEKGEACIQESLGLSRQLGEKWLIGRSLSILASRRLGNGDYAMAEILATEALSLFRDEEDSGSITYLLNLLGQLVAHKGDLDRAAALLEEALKFSRTKTRLRMGSAWTLRNLGMVTLRRGDYANATQYFQESLVLRQELQQISGMAWAMEGLAEVAIQTGNSPRAVRLLGSAVALRTAAGSEMDEPDLIRFTELQAQLRASLGEEAFERLWAEGSILSADAAASYALESVED